MVQKNNALVAQYYEKTQRDYNLVWGLNKYRSIHLGFWDSSTKSFGDALENQNQIMAKQAGISSNDIVLDAGCGIGGSSVYIAKKIGCKVIGITISDKQLAHANKHAIECNVSKLVSFELQDYTSTKFKDHSFSVVWAIESVCHTQNKEDFVKEAFRLLKKGGRLIIADGFAANKKITTKENSEMRLWLDGWIVPNLETPEKFTKTLKKNGFSNIKYNDMTSQVLPSSKRLYYSAYFTTLPEYLTYIFGIRSKTEHANHIAARYQYLTLIKNLWSYGIFYAEKK